MRSSLAVKVKLAKPRVKAARRAVKKLAKVIRKAKSKAKAKIISLDSRRRAKQPALSQLDRENLVVEFRLKAQKLGRSILRKWNSRLDLQEVDSIVDLSLCEAVKRFDPKKGASFITFMYYHLRGNLIRAITTAASQNSVPLADFEGYGASDDNGARYRLPNSVEVAEALIGEDQLMPDEVLYQKELMNISTEACSKLDSLEQEVVQRIYLKEEQLMDIAKSLGYSRCHISRVKKSAIDSLTAEMEERTGEKFILEEEKEERSPVVRRRIQRRKPRSTVYGNVVNG